MSAQATSTSSFNWDDYLLDPLQTPAGAAVGLSQGLEETTSSEATATFAGTTTPLIDPTWPENLPYFKAM